MMNWFTTTDRDWDAISIYKRHYSARKYKDGRANLRSKGFLGPGEKMVLITSRANALFCWVYSKIGHINGQKGVCCTIFRNESGILSSELIKEAVEIGQSRWPGKRMFTYINSAKIRSTNPGYCFIKAGWKPCGYTKGGLRILEKQ
jgi:hypothetical protein